MILVAFDGLYMLEFIKHIFDPLEAFQMSALNWIDIGPRVFPPKVSQYLMFQTSTQSDKAIQSYPSAKAGYRNGLWQGKMYYNVS